MIVDLGIGCLLGVVRLHLGLQDLVVLGAFRLFVLFRLALLDILQDRADQVGRCGGAGLLSGEQHRFVPAKSCERDETVRWRG
ncbi:hypothetical protein D3C71_1959100 [compost metagenome]